MVDSYFLIITVIDIFVLGIMYVLTKYNETLNKWQKQCFMGAFILIIVISVIEVIVVAVDVEVPSLRWINVMANYLGFGLTPAVPLFLAAAMEKNSSIRYAVIGECVYLLVLALSLPFGLIFYVDENNQYIRGNFFVIYVAVYIAAIIYLLVITMQVTERYQNQSRSSVYLIVGFLLVTAVLQVVFPKVYITWLCVSLLSMVYFTYCNGMWQKLDGLTGLLNQKSYLNLAASLSEGGILIVFDVDNFKHINDNYGHLAGDQCLEEVAACIKKAYSKDGLCYRIGGDEFCVFLNLYADEDECYENLLKEMDIRRKTLEILPTVSIGSARFVAGDNIAKAKVIADDNMYQFKKAHKRKEAPRG